MLLIPCLINAEDNPFLAKVLTDTKIKRGFCIIIGSTDGSHLKAFDSNKKFLVYAIAKEASKVQSMRREFSAKGLSGKTMIAYHDLKNLPFADGLANLVVVQDLESALSRGLTIVEVKRLLGPNGVAWFSSKGKWDVKRVSAKLESAGFKNIKSFKDGSLRIVGSSSIPEGTDEWTHHNYGPGGNKVSNDIKVDPPRRLSWIGGMPWQISDYKPKGMVIGKHRVFHVINESSIRKRYWPYLTARDAANGLTLWKKKVNYFNPLRMVIEGDILYMTYSKKRALVALDAETGKVLKTYKVYPQQILSKNGYLYYSEKTLSCMDPKTGAVKWVSKWGVTSKSFANAAIDGDKIVFWDLATKSIGSLNLESGKELWSKSIEGILDKYGKSGKSGELCSYNNGVMIIGGAGIHAFSANDGKHLWSSNYELIGTSSRRKAKSYKDGFFIDNLYWTLVGDLDPSKTGKYKYRGNRKFSWQGLDPLTGNVKKKYPYPRGIPAGASCYRDQATSRFLMGAYTDMFDVKTGKHYPRSVAVRASCAIGARMAYGRMYNCALYIPSSYLQGDMALVGGETPPDNSNRLEKGIDLKASVVGSSSEEDWPSFRHNASRNSQATTNIPIDLKPKWKKDLGGKLSPLTIAEGKVFVSKIDSQEVLALDAKNGNVVWKYHTGGRVVLPPTIEKGKCLFGSNDGWVYCLSSSTGKLIWRYRAAPASRMIVGHERVESPWPVKGAIALQNGNAYLSVGRHADMDGGASLISLNPATGKVLWTKKLDRGAATLTMPLLNKEVISVYSVRTRFALDGSKGKVALPKFSSESYLVQALDPSYIIGAKVIDRRTAIHPLFNVDLKAIISTNELAIVAGFPNSKNEELSITLKKSRSSFPFLDIPLVHPLEEKPLKGASLWLISKKDNKILKKIPLDSTPLFDGLAAARGNLYYVDKSGKITCFGK